MSNERDLRIGASIQLDNSGQPNSCLAFRIDLDDESQDGRPEDMFQVLGDELPANREQALSKANMKHIPFIANATSAACLDMAGMKRIRLNTEAMALAIRTQDGTAVCGRCNPKLAAACLALVKR